ncbi:hypothetical protein [Deinococcus alpinitundrae]|uniref:hypothetical protein n=1 Tax=Deinococcus alpinitundrae TaxID=468913 RepID=UPI0013797645|nr:hypothetical protein [Deinococcus alpinitundrae]
MTLTLEAHLMTQPKQRRRYVAKSRGIKLASQGQLAREHAEAWLKIIRNWETRAATVRLPKMNYAAFRPDPDFSTLGEAGVADSRVLNTPAGEIYEGRLADKISEWERSPVPEQRQVGQVLHKLRHGSGPASLLRDGGWASPRQRSAAIGVALLTLAATFGDEAATHYLPLCRSAMRSGGLD